MLGTQFRLALVTILFVTLGTVVSTVLWPRGTTKLVSQIGTGNQSLGLGGGGASTGGGDCTQLPDCEQTCAANGESCTATCCFQGTQLGVTPCCSGFTCGSDGTCGLCGNGELDAGEECDDGNTNDGDYCMGHCKFCPTGAQCISAFTFDVCVPEEIVGYCGAENVCCPAPTSSQGSSATEQSSAGACPLGTSCMHPADCTSNGGNCGDGCRLGALDSGCCCTAGNQSSQGSNASTGSSRSRSSTSAGSQGSQGSLGSTGSNGGSNRSSGQSSQGSAGSSVSRSSLRSSTSSAISSQSSKGSAQPCTSDEQCPLGGNNSCYQDAIYCIGNILRPKCTNGKCGIEIVVTQDIAVCTGCGITRTCRGDSWCEAGYSECQGDSCVVVLGFGVDECAEDNDCTQGSAGSNGSAGSGGSSRGNSQGSSVSRGSTNSGGSSVRSGSTNSGGSSTIVGSSLRSSSSAFCGDGKVDAREECERKICSGRTSTIACATDVDCQRCELGRGWRQTGMCFGNPQMQCSSDADCIAYGTGPSQCIPNRYCTDQCKRISICGDGKKELLEECDDEWKNNNAAAGGCALSCKKNRCGDGIQQNQCWSGSNWRECYYYTGEGCDDGNIVSDDGCHADCQVERCGDRWVDVNGPDNIFGNADDEGCDDGNLNNFDVCPNDCSSLCGDGVKEAQEECDDGNLVDGDGCTSFCKTDLCGDGVVQSSGLQSPWDEECDDGERRDGDGCSASCLLEFCGDGKVNNFQEERPVDIPDEACDYGSAGGMYTCSMDCQPLHGAPESSSFASSVRSSNASSQSSGGAVSQSSGGNSSSGPSHTECRDNLCLSVQGAGTNQCDPLLGCNTNPQHNVCQNGQCRAVAGSDPNECTSDVTCNQHTECRDVACVVLPGAGQLVCDPTRGCGTTQHTVCAGQACTTVSGAGSNACASNGDCSSQHLVCDAAAQCIVQSGSGPNACSALIGCGQHTVCQGNTCVSVAGSEPNACNPVLGGCGSTHTECNAQNQCVTVQGTGPSTCSPLASCTTHTECQGTVCTVVAGAGGNACDPVLGCGTVKHSICNAGACTTKTGAGPNTCSSSIDCNAHTECNGDACIVRQGSGNNQCDPLLGCGTQSHMQCEQDACVTVAGPGTNTCTTYIDCGEHTECQGLSCIVAAGRGTNSCDLSFGCDTGTTHLVCRGAVCVPAAGAGSNECDHDLACGISAHTQCVAQECLIIEGPGGNACGNDADCFAVCGNGVRELGEACDDGAQNTDTMPDGCRTSCAFPTCGDGVTDAGEQCDDGNHTSGDQCSSSCRWESVVQGSTAFCGDGILSSPEECDDGNSRDRDGCSAECFLERGFCGDGVLQRALDETCEPFLSQGSCNPQTCRFLSTACGNGRMDINEECDSGNANANRANAPCRLDCSLPRCGDRIINSGESCDDGNRLSLDGCSSRCIRESLIAGGAQTVASPLGAYTLGMMQDSIIVRMPDGRIVQLPANAQIPFGATILSQLQPTATRRAPMGNTGPAAVALIAAGAGAGFAWVRRRRKC